MSVLDDHLKKHRQRIIDREEQTFRELLSAYDEIRKDLRRQILELQKKIKDAQAAGEEISPSWFAREDRLKLLTDQVKIQIERFGGTAARITSREQAAAITIAIEQARETIDLVAGQHIGGLMNPRTIENAVGMMGDGSPILEYYKTKLAPSVAEAIRSEVIKAAAMGTDFRTIANRLMATGDITPTRALATARTEVNRVRRETTRQFFQDNSDVITGWEWVSAKSPRTCPACLALDGQIFDIDQVFPQHVNCRCTMIAVIDGVKRPKRVLGQEWFDAESDEVKAQIIGVDGLRAYNEGIVKLKDFVGWTNSKEFGRAIYTKPLSNILMNKPIAELVIRTPKNITVNFEDDAEQVLSEVLGRRLTHNEVGGLVGAFDGAKIRAFDTPVGLAFEVDHPLVQVQQRILSIDSRGRLFIHNNLIRTTRTAPPGMGLKSFATEVHHAERFGIQYIDADAAGNYEISQQKGGWNGYYSWPRMGYNAPLTEKDWAKFPKTFRGIPDLNGLFEQVNGKFVWKYHGTGRPMIFDLDRSSPSWRILEKYLQERGFEIDFAR